MKMFTVMLLCLIIGISVCAQNTVPSGSATQAEFDNFVSEMGTAVWFSPGSSAETLGVTGFDLSTGVDVTDVSKGDSLFWLNTSFGDPGSTITSSQFHIQKGLPGGWDVGAMWKNFGGSNASAWGLEAKYAIVDGSTVIPAVSVRASYSKLSGDDAVSLNTTGIDLMISKGFLMLTPYGGVSMVRIHGASRMAADMIPLRSVTDSTTYFFAGVQLSPFPFVVVNGEVTKGDVTKYALNVGIRF